MATVGAPILNLRFRFAIAAFLLAGTAILLHLLDYEVVLPGKPLHSFPYQLGNLQGSDIPISQEELDILGQGEFLLRDYADPADKNPDVNLFIAYFPSQRAGDTIHSPKHCLPGNGWWWSDRPRILVSLPGHKSFPASRAIIGKDDERELVIYWYWAHDRAVASEVAAKYHLVRDSIRLHRSDGSLFRVITPIEPNETEAAAQQRSLSFANNIGPLMNQYVPQ
jgi:EpsI family protein